eukprot:463696-Pelagomonas_calceolata.AAC.8
MKRLLSAVQRMYPTDPSRSADFQTTTDLGRGVAGAGSHKQALLEAEARGEVRVAAACSAFVCTELCSPDSRMADTTIGVLLAASFLHKHVPQHMLTSYLVCTCLRGYTYRMHVRAHVYICTPACMHTCAHKILPLAASSMR